MTRKTVTFKQWVTWVAVGFCVMMVLRGLIVGPLWIAALGVLAPVIFIAARLTSRPAGMPGESIHTPRESFKAYILFGDDKDIWEDRLGKD